MRLKTPQLRSKSEGELRADLAQCEEELRKLRFEASFNKLKNVAALAEARRLKARILTLLREKRMV